MANSQAFVGNAAVIESRLRSGGADAALPVQLLSGVEVRSAGALRLDADWNLMPLTASGAPGLRVGNAPIALTLRAAGQLDLAHSLSDGFAGGASAPAAVATAGPAASMRLVAGAQLSAANPMRVRDDGVEASVLIGRGTALAPADVMLRSTVGDIDIAAATDVRLLNSGVRIYTSGAPVAATSLPQWGRVGLAPNQQLRDAGVPVGPFFVGAGDVRVSAGRDLVGSPTRSQYLTDWWWRSTNLSSSERPTVWFSRYDLFAQGIASFGGGNLAVRAGRDLVDVEASTPSRGYSLQAGADAAAPAVTVQLPGGDLLAWAGRDVLSGMYFGGGSQAQLQAERSITSAARPTLGASHNGVQLAYASTAWQLRATDDVTIGYVTSPGHLSGLVQVVGVRGDVVAGLGQAASLRALSVAGDVVYRGTRSALASTDPRQNDNSDIVRAMPAQVSLAAPGGDVRLDGTAVLLRDAQGSRLVVQAQGDVGLREVLVPAPASAQAPTSLARLNANTQMRQWRATEAADGTPSATALTVVAQEGDILMRANVAAAGPVALTAGRDVLGSGSAELLLEHRAAADTSVLRAGRDVFLADNTSAKVRLAGPGELVLLAGRDVDLRSSDGLQSIGNAENPLRLPEGGANITVVAGVQWGQADYAAALTSGYALRGSGQGLVPLAGRLWALLQAERNGTPAASALAPALAPAAAAFDALSLAERLAQVRSVVGDAAYESALAQALQRRSGQAEANTVTAQAELAALDAANRADVLQPLIARLVADALPQAQRNDRVRELYLAQPAVQRALWLHGVLFDELRAAGRRAAPLPAGAEREAAYQPGYAAIEALFPGTRQSGGIRLTASQIRTQQDGSIRLLAPGGGVDAGAVTAAAKPASALGVVTAAGGSIEVATQGDFAVNQSRVFTLERGNLLLWSSLGNIDAGRGAKTVVGSPPPVFTVDRDGNVVVDTSGSFSGSGIAVLDAGSALDLYAPKGEINAGEAGIRSSGIAFLAGNVVRGDDFKFDAGSAGGPVKVDSSGVTASLSNLAPTPAASVASASGAQDEDERRNRRQRRSLLLEFLGFGAGE